MRGSNRGISRVVFGFLRAHANERFTSAELAARIERTVAVVNPVLSGNYAMMRSGLHREGIPGHGRGGIIYRYWMSDAGEFARSDPDAYTIARWMIRHGLPSTPSVIAKATGLKIELVVRHLEHWGRKGTVVRCELVLRSGHDRFEYRMAVSSRICLGNARPSAIREAIAA